MNQLMAELIGNVDRRWKVKRRERRSGVKKAKKKEKCKGRGNKENTIKLYSRIKEIKTQVNNMHESFPLQVQTCEHIFQTRN